MVQHDTALDLGGELSDTRWSASHLRRHLEGFRGSTLSPGLGEIVDLGLFLFSKPGWIRRKPLDGCGRRTALRWVKPYNIAITKVPSTCGKDECMKVLEQFV